jgi:WXG100 family type VII secretion target
MSMLGMDVEIVRGVSQQLTGQADEIESVIAAVDGLIAEAGNNWTGDDATAFIDSWNSQHKPALTSAADAIRQLSQTAASQADEQEQTSAG